MVEQKDQGETYTSVLSHVTIPLPKNPLRYTCMPNAVAGEGIWGAAGVNSENVSMTATETITSNERVLSGDPLVVYKKAEDGEEEQIGGIGEEDLVTLVLPYIHSAREGVLRLGELLEQYGTYEMNGIAFSDSEEIWWMETIGGHHYIARRVPDNAYVMMPNQLGIDYFDFEDAFGQQEEYICSKDLKEFIKKNHLDLRFEDEIEKTGETGLIQESASAPIPMRTMCITPQEPGIWQDILTEIPSVSRGKMRSSPRNPMTFPGAYARN